MGAITTEDVSGNSKQRVVQTSFGVTIDEDNAGAKVIQFKEYF